MSDIQRLVDMLIEYQKLPHHTDPVLNDILRQIQTWQKQRLKHTHEGLFTHKTTAPLANYLVDKIYGNDDFHVLADQLLTAGNNALNGSGKLEKLIPANVLSAGILGVQSAIEAIQLDLALAMIYREHYDGRVIDEILMKDLYQKADAKDARLQQIDEIAQVCTQSDKYFNSFILQNAFKLAKNMAYDNGYQPLYDFIGEGLSAMKPLKSIEDFTLPFVQAERAIIQQIHKEN